MIQKLSKLLCIVRPSGHDYEKRPVKDLFDVDEVVGVCRRCGDEATIYEAMSLGGKSVPSELLDQDDVDKLTAMYRDGEIDQDRLELGIRLAIGDESAKEEIEAVTEGSITENEVESSDTV